MALLVDNQVGDEGGWGLAVFTPLQIISHDHHFHIGGSYSWWALIHESLRYILWPILRLTSFRIVTL